MICKHGNTEFRRQPFNKNGKTYNHKCLQCLECGARLPHKSGGMWWSVEKTEDIASLPEVDYNLVDAYKKAEAAERELLREQERSRQQEERSQEDESRRQAWVRRHAEYEVYIQRSPDWQKRRRMVLSRCGNVCEACLNRPATQVHHSNYKHLFSEVLFDLRGVCKECHAKIHNKLKTDSEISEESRFREWRALSFADCQEAANAT